MPSVVEICNNALVLKLGSSRIVSLTENTVNAREINAIYESVRDLELRKHRWLFSVKRVQLPEDATAPDFGYAHQFTLPADCLRVLPPDNSENYNDLDWQIEGRKILTNASAPLNLRYVRQVTDPNEMDSIFRDVWATRMGLELCEKITQSAGKKETLMRQYKDAITEARRINAIEKPVSDDPPEDTWITARL